MKILSLYFLFIISLATKAQRVDSLKSGHGHHFPKEHFLSFGVSANYLTVINNNSLTLQMHGPNYVYGSYNAIINNLNSGLPGFQINYVSYHKVSSIFSYYNGEGFIFYHNKFNYIINHAYTPYYGNEASNGKYYELDTTVTTINSQAFFIHYIIGCHINLPYNFYLNAAIEPHLIVFSNLQSLKYSSTWYDSLGHVSSVYDSSGKSLNKISSFNINATMGIGYKFMASKQQSFYIEFNYCPNIFNSRFLFSSDIDGIALHRYAFELNIGIKL